MEGTRSSTNCGQGTHWSCLHHVHHAARRPHRHRRQGATVSHRPLSLHTCNAVTVFCLFFYTTKGPLFLRCGFKTVLLFELLDL